MNVLAFYQMLTSSCPAVAPGALSVVHRGAMTLEKLSMKTGLGQNDFLKKTLRQNMFVRHVGIFFASGFLLACTTTELHVQYIVYCRRVFYTHTRVLM